MDGTNEQIDPSTTEIMEKSIAAIAAGGGGDVWKDGLGILDPPSATMIRAEKSKEAVVKGLFNACVRACVHPA